VFYGESIECAIARIAKEEIGVKVKIGDMLGYYEIFNDGPYVHSDGFVFAVKIKSGAVRGSYQAKEFQAFRKIPAKMHPPQKIFLKKNWARIRKLLDR